MYVVFDIGGTSMRLGISETGERIDDSQITPTPKNFKEAMLDFGKAVKLLTKGKSVLKAAGGVRALNQEKTALIDHPHFPLWVNEPLKERLEEITGCEVYLENDAAMAGLGEATKGAGIGKKIVAYLTISTGVGGARIVDEKIDKNSLGFEPGQMIVSGGYLEAIISGTALEEKHTQKPYLIDDHSIWEEVDKTLAVGLNNICVLWSPDIIVLGGSLMNKISLYKVQQELKRLLQIFPEPPEVVHSKLDEKAALFGALEYLKSFNTVYT